MSTKPASSRRRSRRTGSARENGPGSSSPGMGGSWPVTETTAAPGTNIHSLEKRSLQQANASLPAGFRDRRMLANAAAGSEKNMTPKREKAASKVPSPRSSTWTSETANSGTGPFPGVTEARAALIMAGAMSSPRTAPPGLTSSPSRRVVPPEPQPMSMTRSPARGESWAMAASPKRPATSSAWASASSQPGVNACQKSRCSRLTASMGPPRSHRSDLDHDVRCP